jgi:hypothetical protein
MMTDTDDRQHRSILQRIAHRAMLERGLVQDFPVQALAELDGIHGPAMRVEGSTRDLTNLLWCSIDNDDSRDPDQLIAAETRHGPTKTTNWQGSPSTTPKRMTQRKKWNGGSQNPPSSGGLHNDEGVIYETR